MRYHIQWSLRFYDEFGDFVEECQQTEFLVEAESFPAALVRAQHEADAKNSQLHTQPVAGSYIPRIISLTDEKGEKAFPKFGTNCLAM